jgi:hypothetical protein
MRQFAEAITLLSAQAATGAATPFLVDDFTHLILALDTTDSAALTAKIKGSIQQTAPDFTASQSPTNQWDTIQIKDLQDGSTVNGDTGFAPAGSDDHRLFEINVNALRWVTVHVTAFTAGKLYAVIKPYSAT